MTSSWEAALCNSEPGTPGRRGLSPALPPVGCAASHGPAASLGLSPPSVNWAPQLSLLPLVCRLGEIQKVVEPQAVPGTRWALGQSWLELPTAFSVMRHGQGGRGSQLAQASQAPVAGTP